MLEVFPLLIPIFALSIPLLAIWTKHQTKITELQMRMRADELTDTDADEVAIGGRVEMTFRRLFTADGIHKYFWKGKLIRG